MNAELRGLQFGWESEAWSLQGYGSSFSPRFYLWVFSTFNCIPRRSPPVNVSLRWCKAPDGGGTVLDYVFLSSLILAGLAVVGVFIEIPIVSNYAFWVAISAYVLLASHRQRVIWRL